MPGCQRHDRCRNPSMTTHMARYSESNVSLSSMYKSTILRHGRIPLVSCTVLDLGLMRDTMLMVDIASHITLPGSLPLELFLFCFGGGLVGDRPRLAVRKAQPPQHTFERARPALYPKSCPEHLQNHANLLGTGLKPVRLRVAIQPFLDMLQYGACQLQGGVGTTLMNPVPRAFFLAFWARVCLFHIFPAKMFYEHFCFPVVRCIYRYGFIAVVASKLSLVSHAVDQTQIFMNRSLIAPTGSQTGRKDTTLNTK